MKCPHCEKEIPGVSCPECHEESPEGAAYCMRCGALLAATDTPAAAADGDEFDLDDRILCPDGTCTGIIVAGKCTECGKPYVAGGEAPEDDGGGEGAAPAATGKDAGEGESAGV